MTHDTDFRDADGLIVRHGSDVPVPTMPSPFRDPTLTELTVEITAAYVTGNSVQPGDLPALLSSIYGALARLGRPMVAETPKVLVPAVPIKKSVHEDYIVCLDDGKRFKSLRRHLAGLSMTPAEYRAKWGLPAGYPMVAPAYAAKRSALAKGMGLGSKRRVG